MLYLLKAVVLEDFESVNVEHADHGRRVMVVTGTTLKRKDETIRRSNFKLFVNYKDFV